MTRTLRRHGIHWYTSLLFTTCIEVPEQVQRLERSIAKEFRVEGMLTRRDGEGFEYWLETNHVSFPPLNLHFLQFGRVLSVQSCRSCLEYLTKIQKSLRVPALPSVTDTAVVTSSRVPGFPLILIDIY